MSNPPAYEVGDRLAEVGRRQVCRRTEDGRQVDGEPAGGGFRPAYPPIEQPPRRWPGRLPQVYRAYPGVT